MTTKVRAFGDETLRQIIEQHPFLALESFQQQQPLRIDFDNRTVQQANINADIYGLTELIDNNPLVCTNDAATTGPEATLAMVALGPLARAGLIREIPAIAINFEGNDDEIAHALKAEGWQQGVILATENQTPEILEAQCIAEIELPGNNAQDIHNLYEECYSRSFFIRTEPPKVNEPHAAFQVDVETRGGGAALAIVKAQAARNGKCGAAALVHMLNVMCGFEESLGLETK